MSAHKMFDGQSGRVGLSLSTKTEVDSLAAVVRHEQAETAANLTISLHRATRRLENSLGLGHFHVVADGVRERTATRWRPRSGAPKAETGGACNAAGLSGARPVKTAFLSPVVSLPSRAAQPPTLVAKLRELAADPEKLEAVGVWLEDEDLNVLAARLAQIVDARNLARAEKAHLAGTCHAETCAFCATERWAAI